LSHLSPFSHFNSVFAFTKVTEVWSSLPKTILSQLKAALVILAPVSPFTHCSPCTHWSPLSHFIPVAPDISVKNVKSDAHFTYSLALSGSSTVDTIITNFHSGTLFLSAFIDAIDGYVLYTAKASHVGH
jgi:hypothetical protein